MRKIIALFFVVLFLFNFFGYRLVVQYLQRKVSTQLEVRLDNNLYEDSQLIELKVPLLLPYQTNWSAFQRYNGEIEIGGMMYKYVKRKMANDTLYLMCVLNTKKMHLETAKNDFFKATNDLTQNTDSKKTDNSKNIAFKNIQGEYDDYSLALYTIIPYENFRNFWPVLNFRNVLSSPHTSPEQPPDFQKV